MNIHNKELTFELTKFVKKFVDDARYKTSNDYFNAVKEVIDRWGREGVDVLISEIDASNYVSLVDAIFDMGDENIISCIVNNSNIKSNMKNRAINGMGSERHIFYHLIENSANGNGIEKLKMISGFFDEITKDATQEDKYGLENNYFQALIRSSTKGSVESLRFLESKLENKREIKKEAVMAFLLKPRGKANLDLKVMKDKIHILMKKNGELDIDLLRDVSHEYERYNEIYWPMNSNLFETPQYKIFKTETDKMVLTSNIKKTSNIKNKKTLKI